MPRTGPPVGDALLTEKDVKPPHANAKAIYRHHRNKSCANCFYCKVSPMDIGYGRVDLVKCAKNKWLGSGGYAPIAWVEKYTSKIAADCHDYEPMDCDD